MRLRRSLLQLSKLYFAFLVCVTSCAPALTINNSYNREALFQTYQTYAWLTPTAQPERGVTAGSPQDQQIRATIESALVKQGLRPATEAADVYITYDIALDTDTQIPEGAIDPAFGYGASYRNGYRYTYTTTDFPGYRAIDNYTPGTIIVDIIDVSTNTLVWRGWADAAFTPDTDEKDITRIMTSIMTQYPPEFSRIF